MQLSLHCSVSLQLFGKLQKLLLKVFTLSFALFEQLLVLLHIFLQIVEYLKFFIQSNKGVQLVLKLNLFFLEC